MTLKSGLYEVKLHGHWKIEDFNLGAFLLNIHLQKNILCSNGYFLELLSDMGETNCSHLFIVILQRNRIKAHQSTSHLDSGNGQIPSCATALSDVTWCACVNHSCT
jgi:hypothetical protein